MGHGCDTACEGEARQSCGSSVANDIYAGYNFHFNHHFFIFLCSFLIQIGLKCSLNTDYTHYFSMGILMFYKVTHYRYSFNETKIPTIIQQLNFNSRRTFSRIFSSEGIDSYVELGPLGP